jgi:hypothetical protein
MPEGSATYCGVPKEEQEQEAAPTMHIRRHVAVPLSSRQTSPTPQSVALVHEAPSAAGPAG